MGARGEGGVASWVLARFGVGALLSMNVMMISLVLYTDVRFQIDPQTVRLMGWAMLILSTPALIVLGSPFALGAAREIRRRSLSMDSLITTGALGAFGVSAANVLRGGGPVYFDTATMLLVLITLGKLLEASAKSKTAEAVKGLMALASPRARVLNEQGEIEVPPDQVKVGDRLLVKPGERIPADGVIVSGAGAVEEAAFTGESQPRACGPGSHVFGGSINLDGLLTVEASAVGEKSLLGQVTRMVAAAQRDRAPSELMAERIASAFVPLVWFIAATAGLAWALLLGNPERGAMSALSVLVVACPCALGLATPLVTSLAIGRAARCGVLIRSGRVLETLPRVSLIFLDKTGTLTRGRLTVSQVHATSPSSMEPDEAFAWLATLESGSAHPVASAIVAEANARRMPLGNVEEFRSYPGSGVRGRVSLNGGSRLVWAGTPEFLNEEGLNVSDASPLREQGTALYWGWEGAVRGLVTLADEPRTEARDVVQALACLGLRPVMLSGDRAEVAEPLARALGIADVLSRCTPADKLLAIRRARQEGKLVAMVGDGINDAPALAEADVGVAMAGGTDLARESSDVTLLGDDLGRLPRVVGLAGEARRKIRQNLAWAFGYNLAAIGIAAFGYLHPLLAAILMLGSSFFVLGNTLSLLRHPGQ
jgi:heavy metal translocating P-type ATPase